jgi:TrmH family RNA methyltransferase
MERITSRQNAIVKLFRDAAAGGSAAEWMLLDGGHLVAEALASSIRLEVLALGDRQAERLDDLPAQAERSGARVVAVNDQVLKALSPVRHPSGVVALAERRMASVADVLAAAPQLVVVLAGVQDPGNVGAIVRVAEGCGATGVVTTEGTADPFSWKALRGSMGSAFRVPIAPKQPLATVIGATRAAGLRLFATVPRGGTPLPLADLRGPALILLGGEGGGLADGTASEADECLTIPMRPSVESLNVATAAALVLYEASRQRSAGRSA